jgi:hypothetical protein
VSADTEAATDEGIAVTADEGRGATDDNADSPEQAEEDDWRHEEKTEADVAADAFFHLYDGTAPDADEPSAAPQADTSAGETSAAAGDASADTSAPDGDASATEPSAPQGGDVADASVASATTEDTGSRAEPEGTAPEASDDEGGDRR